MRIDVEITPNPMARKFVPDTGLLAVGHEPVQCVRGQAHPTGPLIVRLFEDPDVTQLFLTDTFVSVSKATTADWDALQPHILDILLSHLSAHLPILDMPTAGSNTTTAGLDFDPEDAEIVEQIQELLEERVRPYVQSDGGDIVFLGYRDNVVTLKMEGACSGCPSSSATMRVGVLNLLRHYVSSTLTIETPTEIRTHPYGDDLDLESW